MIIDEITALILEQAGEYEQTLWTIFYSIPESEYKAFKRLIVKANKGSKKLLINDSKLEELWDSFTLEVVEIV